MKEEDTLAYHLRVLSNGFQLLLIEIVKSLKIKELMRFIVKIIGR